jgi:hypothetical protein
MILQLEAKRIPGDMPSPVFCVPSGCIHVVMAAGAWRERAGVDQQRLAQAKATLDAAGSGPAVSLDELRALRRAAVPTRG